MARGELGEVGVQGEHDPVADPPRLPGHDHDDPHAPERSDAVAVVVCCRDRADLLAEALPAVRAELRPGDELVVVDSASRDAQVGEVAQAAGAVVVRCAQPGLSRARNAGWRATTAPVVLFTDDDCRPLVGWAQGAREALADPRVGVVWGRVGADREAGVPLSVSDDDGPEAYDGSGDLSATGHGAAMGFRREVLEALGGFDEALGAGGVLPAGEDKDAFWRAVRAGWQVRSAPAMAVTHVTWRATSEALRTTYRYGVGAGAVAGKRRRLAGERGLVRGELWRHGLLPAARWARDGRYAAATGALARSGGVLVGARAARRAGLVDGHLVVRR